MSRASHPPQPLYVRSFGTGPRKVLALHCTIAHSGAWRGLADLMHDVTTFVTPDMLSHGRSPDWDKKGDFLDRSTQAALPLLSEPMDVVGHSFGAAIALRLAVANPGMVRSLTMIEPVYFAVALQDNPQTVADHDAETSDFTAALHAGNDAVAARLFNRMWGDGKSSWAELPEPSRAAMIRGVHVVKACQPTLYDDYSGMLNPGVLEAVATPTLVLRGGETHPAVTAVCDGLTRRMPDAQCRVIDGAGHMVPITHPTETVAALRQLFARVPV